jgi:hypothetical protein
MLELLTRLDLRGTPEGMSLETLSELIPKVDDPFVNLRWAECEFERDIDRLRRVLDDNPSLQDTTTAFLITIRWHLFFAHRHPCGKVRAFFQAQVERDREDEAVIWEKAKEICRTRNILLLEQR